MNNIGLTDAPIERLADESLGLRHHVEALSEFIQSCHTPITIACQGDWGTGKTSMMKMVCEKLKESQDTQQIETLWFNTWQFAQFQMQDEITLSLLSSFLEELGDSEVRKILRSLGRLAFNRLSDIAKAAAELSTGTGDIIKDALDNAIQQDGASAVRQLRSKIQAAVVALLKKKNAARIVVFIDDLDRLAPERAVEILETIKLFLDIPECVFVLAVDYHVVSKGLEKKFGVSTSDLKGKSFFDKIIQLPFNLPVAQYDIRRYTVRLFGQFKFKEEDTDLLVQLAENSIGANPRSLKRLFNTLQLLNIVARKKNMLDADAIATAEERQRLLFAVLCLQLAYEPVYLMLLKDPQQLCAEYFEMLADAERLRTEPGQFATVQKALAGRGEMDEALVRFTAFMGALMDAIRLDVNKGEAEKSLTDNEIKLLRGFLSLSVLTSKIDMAEDKPDSFRHEAKMLDFLERTLKPKYQDTLEKMKTGFKTDFSQRMGRIGFNFNLRAFAFDLWVVWDDGAKNLRSTLWTVPGAERTIVRDWFQSKSAFQNIDFLNIRKNEYGVIEKLSFEDNSSSVIDGRHLVNYFELAERTLDTSIPLLVEFYESRRALIESVIAFTDKLSSRLVEKFPASNGWLVENLLRTLVKGANIKVHHSEWNNAFMICLEAPWEPFARNFVFGLKDEKSKRAYSDGVKECRVKEEVVQICEKILFPEDSHNLVNDYFIYSQHLPDSIRYLYKDKGKFLDPNCRYAFDTPEQEAQAIEQIVERFTRFKQIEPELKRLAAAAKQP